MIEANNIKKYTMQLLQYNSAAITGSKSHFYKYAITEPLPKRNKNAITTPLSLILNAACHHEPTSCETVAVSLLYAILSSSVSDPDQHGSAIKWTPWIWIRIRDADSGSGSSSYKITQIWEGKGLKCLFIYIGRHALFVVQRAGPGIWFW